MRWPLPPQLETPVLVVDYDTLVRNIDTMATAMRERNVALRPHAKTHKSPEIGRIQLEHGAVGLTLASIGEAEVFAAAGFDDIFIAYPLYVSAEKAARLRKLSEAVRLSVGLDSIAAAEALARSGAAVRVLVEIDTGGHRSGVLPDGVVPVARACRDLGLEIAGVFTHGGHGYRDPSAAGEAGDDEAEGLALARDRLAAEGITVETLSAGSTPTALASARDPVTEERPGTYVLNDRQQLELGSARADDVALVAVATVVSTAVPGQMVIDAGSKTLSSDRLGFIEGFGILPDLPGAVVTALSECHGVVRLGDAPPPPVGTIVRVVPNHVCPAVNLTDELVVASNGEVVDRWPVSARGHLQ